MDFNANSPAYLLVGTHETAVYEKAFSLMRTQLCTDLSNAHCYCQSCRQMRNHQHHAVLWLTPDKNYKIEDLVPLFERVQLAQNPGESFFFVLQKAHLLSAVCANKLLKVLEEPPTGYYFMLLASYDDALPATLISRCHVIPLEANAKASVHPMVTFFTSSLNPDPFVFEQELKRSELSNLESIELYNTLLAWALEQHKNALVEGNEKEPFFKELVSFLKSQYKRMPAPGGAELFWKSLYLSMPRL